MKVLSGVSIRSSLIVSVTYWLGASLFWVGCNQPIQPQSVAQQQVKQMTKTKSSPLPKQVSKESIQRVIEAGIPGLKVCRNKHQEESQQRSLRVVMKFIVNQKGEVQSANIQNQLTHMPQFNQCIVQWAKQRKFVASQQNKLVITYPINFTFHNR